MRRLQDPKRFVLFAHFPLLLAFSPPLAGDDAPGNALTRTVYLAEVASYCSLVDARVAAGFRRERERIVAEQNLDAALIEAARMEGWKQAHAEWQNRGLGGFRNWCRTEGMAAAAFFRRIAEAD